MKSRYEVRLAGVGGQGILLAGLVLAEAAIRGGRNALQTQSYGAENRGGPSSSEVIIADGEIDYPKVIKADLLLAMSASALEKYASDLAEGGTIVADAEQTAIDRAANRFSLPITALAESATGVTATASMAALGIIASLTGIVSPEALLSAIEDKVPSRSREVNRRAALAGLEEGRRLRSS